jgi:hypothetical protein
MNQRFDFDEWTKDLARGVSRREALRRLGGGLLGAAAAVGLGLGKASADGGGIGQACVDCCNAITPRPEPFGQCVSDCVHNGGVCGPTCVAQGGGCSQNSDCCFGICPDSRVCACVPDGLHCNSDSECCLGLTCNMSTLVCER